MEKSKSEQKADIIGNDANLLGAMFIVFLLFQLFWVMNNINNQC